MYNKAFFLCSIFSVFLMVMTMVFSVQLAKYFNISPELMNETALALTMVFSVQLAKYFNISPELMNETALALKTTAFAYAFFGVTRVTSAYFYATNHTKFSNLLIYIEPIVIAPAMLWIFTELFGLSGVWMAYPAIQVILSSISLVLKSPNMEHKTIVIAPAMLWIFTELFGLSGVWMAYPAIQVILSSISLVLKSPNMEHKKELKVATVQ